MAGINIDHKKGRIESTDDKILKLAEKGAVKIGNGKYLSNNASIEITPRPEYAGCIRYNEDTKTLELCTGYMWKPLGGDLLLNDSIVWGMIFSGK